jgi:hypothetical protein
MLRQKRIGEALNWCVGAAPWMDALGIFVLCYVLAAAPRCTWFTSWVRSTTCKPAGSAVTETPQLPSSHGMTLMNGLR